MCFAKFEEQVSVACHTGVLTMELMIVGEAKLSVKVTGWKQLISGPFVDFFGPRHIVETFPTCLVTPHAVQQISKYVLQLKFPPQLLFLNL